MVYTVSCVLDLSVGGHKVSCSPEHPLWVSGIGWREADTLNVGDLLLTESACPVQIESVERHQGVFTVHNIEIAGMQQYRVSELRIIAHNKPARRPAKKPKKGGKGKAGATDIPSWAKGNVPYVDESGKEFATRVMNEHYGEGNWSAKSKEFSEIKKYGDRHFG